MTDLSEAAKERGPVSRQQALNAAMCITSYVSESPSGDAACDTYDPVIDAMTMADHLLATPPLDEARAREILGERLYDDDHIAGTIGMEDGGVQMRGIWSVEELEALAVMLRLRRGT